MPGKQHFQLRLVRQPNSIDKKGVHLDQRERLHRTVSSRSIYSKIGFLCSTFATGQGSVTPLRPFVTLLALEHLVFGHFRPIPQCLVGEPRHCASKDDQLHGDDHRSGDGLFPSRRLIKRTQVTHQALGQLFGQGLFSRRHGGTGDAVAQDHFQIVSVALFELKVGRARRQAASTGPSPCPVSPWQLLQFFSNSTAVCAVFSPAEVSDEACAICRLCTYTVNAASVELSRSRPPGIELP